MTYTFTENVWLVFAPTVTVGFVRLGLDVKTERLSKIKSCEFHFEIIMFFHFLSIKFFFIFWWRQLAAGRSLNCASCQGGWDERSCPRSAMAMHSVAVNRHTKPSSWETDTLSLSYCRPNLFLAIFTHLLNFRNPFNFHATRNFLQCMAILFYL